MEAEYAELWCKTAFSFLEGASMPESLVERAGELGLSAVGVCDRDGVYGLVRAWKASKDLKDQHRLLPDEVPRPPDVLHGACVTLLDEQAKWTRRRQNEAPPSHNVVLYAQHETGWHSLCELLTRGRAEQPKGHSLLRAHQVAELNHGLIALVDGQWPAESLAEAFGDRLYVCASRQLLPTDAERVRRAQAFAARVGRQMVAVNRVLQHDPGQQKLQDVLTCIREKVTIDQAGTLLQPNAERHLKAPAEMLRLFHDHPDWVARTVQVAARCGFRLDQLRYEYPREVVPEGMTPMNHLRGLVAEGMSRRYPDRPAPARILATLEHELQVIEQLEFPAYFLTVHDIVRFARSQGILCQGRGSAANSVICYALGISSVDPSRHRLLFERFISKERGEPPDIDVDFEHERREEVIQYVFNKYGRDRAAMVNEIISYRRRSGVRDVGKAMGLSLDQVDRLAKNIDWWDASVPDDERVKETGIDTRDPVVARTLELTTMLQGFPRHLSIHVGGFVISEHALRHRCPIEPAAMADRTVIQWDKDDIGAVNFVKVDVLALGMLTAIQKCFDMVELWHGKTFDLATVPAEDPSVYDMICRADTVGVFQIESRAQMSMLPRLRPRCFYDLVIEVAIVRPGPIQGGMVHPYLARRHGDDPVTFPHPDLKPILERTLGVPIFQEQVMEMAMTIGGFTGGEADQLRRAMGAWRKRGGLQPLVQKLMRNMRANGLEQQYADRIAKQIMGFGEYGFPESHAISFALLVYVSCYLKAYFPAAFTAALLNSQPMGFYSARNLIDDARRHMVEVRAVDVNLSGWHNTLEPDGSVDSRAPGFGSQGRIGRGVAIRLGLRQISGLGKDTGERLERVRSKGDFADVADVARRAQLNHKELLALARADAFACFGHTRRQAAWVVKGLSTAPLLRGIGMRDHQAPLPVPNPYEDIQQAFLATGFSLNAHPVGLVRPGLDERGALRLADLAHCEAGEAVSIGALITGRQRPGTATGIVFLSVEDESAMSGIVVKPELYSRQRKIIRHSKLVVIHGVLQRDGDATSILAKRFEAIDLGELRAPSRDFR